MPETVLANGEKIKKERKKKGWTQAQLAAKAHLDVRTVRHAEHGEHVMIGSLGLIAKALKVSVDDILADKGMWPEGAKRVNFIKHFDQKPGPEFKTPRVLEILAQHRGKVEVLGRTCRSWLVGPDPARTSDLQDLIVKAASNHSEIHLVVQKATVRVPFFSNRDMTRLREHLRECVTSYRQIHDRLRKKHIPKDRVKLFFTNQPNLQSMTRIKRGQDRHAWLLVSVRTDFKPEEQHISVAELSSMTAGQRSFEWDPQIIFRWDAPQAEEYRAKFDLILRGSKEPGVPVGRPVRYSDYRAELLQKTNEAVDHYNDEHGSALREDTGANLAAQGVRHFLARTPGSASVPPVCVQLLVTSQCPGHCQMCTQWKRNLPDPSTEEVKDLLRHISALGAGSVIISGGEPLYREDIFDILEFASSETELALGIMTRGICMKDSRPSALRQDDANKLADACRWIQISIDTFSTSSGGTGQSNRGDWDLKKAVRSAQRIWLAVEEDKSRVEICFTIHKGNIEEIIDEIPKSAWKIGIPKGMPIRLKFAHSSADADFLCSPHNLYRLKEKVRQLAEGEDLNFNTKYLWNMMDRDSEVVRDVANGHPVETALRQCQKRGDKCYVQGLICTIDCDGKVYPCCYLFDDTAQTSTTRRFIGDLRDPAGRTILSFQNHRDKLKSIWQSRPESPNLPVDQLACARCTRHLHQNELLNKIHRILDEGSPLGIAEALEDALNQKTKEDRYFWL